MRVSKFISENGIASRRKAEEFILNGRVSVNNKLVTQLGTKIDPQKDSVRVDQKLITLNTEKIYYLLNKPIGYTTTTKDRHAKHTVLELVPKTTRVFPVGRLDKNTTGLLILTNDGDLAFRLTHPKFEKEKEYEVFCSSKLSNDNIKKLKKGIHLEDGPTLPVKIKTIKDSPNEFIYSIIIREGRKRQIRRMFEHIGNRVVKLKRVRIDKLRLEGLKEGDWRNLKKDEVKKLYGEKH